MIFECESCTVTDAENIAVAEVSPLQKHLCKKVAN